MPNLTCATATHCARPPLQGEESHNSLTQKFEVQEKVDRWFRRESIDHRGSGESRSRFRRESIEVQERVDRPVDRGSGENQLFQQS
jgi:hypothetical protein